MNKLGRNRAVGLVVVNFGVGYLELKKIMERSAFLSALS